MLKIFQAFFPQKQNLLTFQKRYAKILKRIKNKKSPIKVIFLVSENQKWGYQNLYDLLANDERFEPIILISLLKSVHQGNDKTRCNLKENYDFFKSRNMNVEYCYKKDNYITLKKFKPDIVFYEQPWDLPHNYLPKEISKFALTCYVPYGLGLFEYNENYSNFHKTLWRYFIDSELNKKNFIKYDKLASKNCIVTGYPKLDCYFKKINPFYNSLWKDVNKKKIIYAPHHSFEKDGLNLATFKKNGLFILELAKKFSETTWIFKPHPRFKMAIIANSIFSKNEIENYYKEWEKIGNIYTKGEYIDIFRTSDLMLTDCGSFLGEYLPTEKPIIRLINSNSAKLNNLGNIINDSLYCANSNKDLETIFKKLIHENHDEKKLKRIAAKELIINKNSSSSNIIYQHLIENIIRKEREI